MKKIMVSSAILLMVAFGSLAQQMPKILVEVPFQFRADTNLVPAGTYELQPNGMQTHIQLRDVKTDKRYIARVLTTLSSRESGRSAVVFDVEGQNRYLSEVYIAGIDGFAIEASKTKHNHTIIPAKTIE